MVDASVANIELTKEGKMEGNIVKVDGHKHRIDELQIQVDKVIFLRATQNKFLSVKTYTNSKT